jgi:ribosomal protein L37E
MTESSGSDDQSILSPQQAFSVLGDETRLGILQSLGKADGPLLFSELFRQSDCETSANFSYHLDQLKGHFLHESEEGYVLQQAGRRVIEAVLAEAVPETTTVERTTVDWTCFLCGSPVELSYREGHVGIYCSACGGTRDHRSTTTVGRLIDEADVLGILDLPPAGTINRTPEEFLDVAEFWTTLETLALSREICPRCSAALDITVSACEEHEGRDQLCETCGQRFAIVLQHDCTNCIYGVNSPIWTYLFDNLALIEFLIAHDIDPFVDPGIHFQALDETVYSTNPLEAELTVMVDGNSISFRVDDRLYVEQISKDAVGG